MPFTQFLPGFLPQRSEDGSSGEKGRNIANSPPTSSSIGVVPEVQTDLTPSTPTHPWDVQHPSWVLFENSLLEEYALLSGRNLKPKPKVGFLAEDYWGGI